jgi:hypothetical protein
MRSYTLPVAMMTGFLIVAAAGAARADDTPSQMSVRRVRSDSFGYLLLGFGRVFGNQTYRGPNDGIGYRAELDSFGVDVAASLLRCACGGPEPEPVGMGWNVTGLYFLKPAGDASMYVGGGLGQGGTEFSNYNVSSSTSWHGSGLQGRLTAGYEVSRAGTRDRLFVQADAVLPFYRTRGETVIFSRTARRVTTKRRYTPSLSISVGIGFN